MKTPEKSAPGILTPVEAARLESPLWRLRYSDGFVSGLCEEHFQKTPKEDPLFKDDLWNVLEGAYSVHQRILQNGILQADFENANATLRKLDSTVKQLRKNGDEKIEGTSLALAFFVQIFLNREDDQHKPLSAEAITQLVYDGHRFKTLLTEVEVFVEKCLLFDPPSTLRKNEDNALRAWCICILQFWTNRADKKPRITKLSEPGGVRIISKLGRFCERCLSEVGIDAKYELRSPLEFARTQLKKNDELKRLLASGDYAAATLYMENWKDRFPIASM